MSSVEERIRDIIEVAISNEENAEQFYRESAETVQLEHARKTLLELAREEVSHADFLRKVLNEGFEQILEHQPEASVEEVRIVDYLSVPELNAYSNLQDILTVAMKREQIAFEFYDSMAAMVNEPELKRVLNKLAEVEAGHKTRLQDIYEREFFQEN